MRAILVVASLVAIGLAGCSDAPKPSGDGFSDELDEQLQATDTTGVIRGLVIDTTITPIEGASIVLTGQGKETTSNAEGLFGFSGLDPGTYFMDISAPGYGQVQQAVDVQAGVDKPPLAKVQLQADQTTAPYYMGDQWDGFLGCSFRRWDPPSGGRGQSCPLVETIWPEHDFIVDYPLEQVPSWVTSEMIWESTQYLGDEMSFNLRRTDTIRDTKDIEGVSPLAITLNATDIELGERGGEPVGGFGPDMPLRVIIFTAHLQQTEPPTGGWGFGLQLDQSFSVYTHIFFNYEPPSEWRFLDDPNVPQP